MPDHGHDALRRAGRAAVGLTVATAAGVSVGGTQTPLFTIFGTFALLVLADLPGSQRTRAAGYAVLSLVGAMLICVGSWLSPHVWLAVPAMFVVAVVVTFSSVLSTTFAAAGRAVLMALVLPLTAPAGPLSERLLGWGIGAGISVLAAVFLFPPRHFETLRTAARAVCLAAADAFASPPGTAAGDAARARVGSAMDGLRAEYVSASARPIGLSAGSRALIRVVDDLETLTAQVTTTEAAPLPATTDSVVAVLRASAAALDPAVQPAHPATRAALDTANHQLHEATLGPLDESVADLLDEPDDAVAVRRGQQLVTARTVTSVVELTGRAVAVSAAADARPVLDRLIGRRLPEMTAVDQVGPARVALPRITGDYLHTRSVIARRSLQTGLSLALAVGLTYAMPLSHAFWVVLGTMSVLRTSALTTGATVLRAVAGTTLGFIAGALLVTAIGSDARVLWAVLPVAALLAAYVPERVSFTAGQGAFTVFILVVFNLLQPSGWAIGVVRVEDIALGCAVAIVASLLLWPHGLSTVALDTIAAADRAARRYLTAATDRVIGTGPDDPDAERLATLARESLAASRTLDDALRFYLSGGSGQADQRTSVVGAANRATRIRQVGDAIADLPLPTDPGRYARLRGAVAGRLALVEAGLLGPARGPVRRAGPADTAERVVQAMRADHLGDPISSAEAAGAIRPLVSAAAYLDELLVLDGTPSSAGVATTTATGTPDGPPRQS